jgi:hypothetical protein
MANTLETFARTNIRKCKNLGELLLIGKILLKKIL